MSESTTLNKQDFVSDQDVRWCPGCGDYAILSQVQKVFPNLWIPKENFLIVSGIGWSSGNPWSNFARMPSNVGLFSYDTETGVALPSFFLSS